MKDDRLLVLANEKDLLALGRAAFVFAQLEWQVVWCLEKLKPNYVRRLGRKTAGNIANDFQNAVSALTDAKLQTALAPSATEFKRLVDHRNAIMHGKPGTAPDGSQLLFRQGTPWTQKRLEDIADDFAACNRVLNGLFYGVLGGP